MVVHDSSYLAKCDLISMREFKRSGENPGPINCNMKTLRLSIDVK